MTGWDSPEEALAKARALADELGMTQDDLRAAGRRYISEYWQAADPENETQVIEAVAEAQLLNCLRGYLEEAKETKGQEHGM